MTSTSAAMTASTFQLFLIAVLAATLIEELTIDRWQLGLLGAVNTGVGAVVAPRLGVVADRLGPKRSMIGVFVTSGIGLLATAAAPGFAWLVAASAISGVPQGAGNPVTNKLIAEQVPQSQQNSVMGVKQSGVQFAVFLAGITMPTAAASFGWRWAVTASAGVAFVFAVLMLVRPDGDVVAVAADDPDDSGAVGAGEDVAADDRVSTRGFVNQVAIYAFLMGLCAGGVTRFYPLFANEVLGYSETVAGWAVAIAGLAAIGGRLWWAQLVKGRFAFRPALVIMALGSAVSLALLYVAEADLRWLLWPAVLGLALTVSAWNVVAMLAVIRSVPRRHAGSATGVVLMGFLGGLTVAAPLVGYSIDVFGSYRPAWVLLGLLALAAAVAVRDRSSVRTRRSATPA
ncbi:MAG: MFS transporter [Actinomycetota bacterium]